MPVDMSICAVSFRRRMGESDDCDSLRARVLFGLWPLSECDLAYSVQVTHRTTETKGTYHYVILLFFF